MYTCVCTPIYTHMYAKSICKHLYVCTLQLYACTHPCVHPTHMCTHIYVYSTSLSTHLPACTHPLCTYLNVYFLYSSIHTYHFCPMLICTNSSLECIPMCIHPKHFMPGDQKPLNLEIWQETCSLCVTASTMKIICGYFSKPSFCFTSGF